MMIEASRCAAIPAMAARQLGAAPPKLIRLRCMSVPQKASRSTSAVSRKMMWTYVMREPSGSRHSWRGCNVPEHVETPPSSLKSNLMVRG